MAEMKKLKFPDLIKNVLIDGLKSQRIEAEVDSEPIRSTRMHRVIVLAKKFKQLHPRERQNLVWHIVDNKISREDQLSISSIVTVTPKEFAGK